jgi:hypothetical protein
MEFYESLSNVFVEKVFQNPLILQQQISLSPEQSTLVLFTHCF